MASSSLLLPMLLLLFAATVPAGSRPAPIPHSLAERLDGEAPQQCWESLMEIKSCTGEIILFFINGEAYLGPGCCHAIRVIEQHCWAADTMMSAIGFTPEEGDMLKGYCDVGDAEGQQPGLLLSPPPPGHHAVLVPASDGIAGDHVAVMGTKNLVHH